MRKLPEKFPEYMIMYRTISEQIKKIEKDKKLCEVESKIKNYKSELNKIKEMFPDNFFDKFD